MIATSSLSAALVAVTIALWALALLPEFLVALVPLDDAWFRWLGWFNITGPRP